MKRTTFFTQNKYYAQNEDDKQVLTAFLEWKRDRTNVEAWRMLTKMILAKAPTTDNLTNCSKKSLKGLTKICLCSLKNGNKKDFVRARASILAHVQTIPMAGHITKSVIGQESAFRKSMVASSLKQPNDLSGTTTKLDALALSLALFNFKTTLGNRCRNVRNKTLG